MKEFFEESLRREPGHRAYAVRGKTGPMPGLSGLFHRSVRAQRSACLHARFLALAVRKTEPGGGTGQSHATPPSEGSLPEFSMSDSPARCLAMMKAKSCGEPDR
jgi:hypothetical protein